MNADAKVVLTITGIEGRTRHFAGKRKVKTTFTYRDKKTKKIVEREVYYKIPYYEYLPVSKRINLSKQFFDYATSSECPNWFSNYGGRKDLVRRWEKMKWDERLEAWLLRICLDNGGKEYSYNILED